MAKRFTTILNVAYITTMTSRILKKKKYLKSLVEGQAPDIIADLKLSHEIQINEPQWFEVLWLLKYEITKGYNMKGIINNLFPIKIIH